jgi:hypothetical protein
MNVMSKTEQVRTYSCPRDAVRNTTVTVKPTWENTYLEFSQTLEGWPGSKFKHRNDSMKVRRVRRVERNISFEQVQIEIQSVEVKESGRAYTTHSSITLPSGAVAELIEALTTIRNKQG